MLYFIIKLLLMLYFIITLIFDISFITLSEGSQGGTVGSLLCVLRESNPGLNLGRVSFYH